MGRVHLELVAREPSTEALLRLPRRRQTVVASAVSITEVNREVLALGEPCRELRSRCHAKEGTGREAPTAGGLSEKAIVWAVSDG